MYGAVIPTLQGIATKVLSQPATAAACEQNWSTFKQV